MKKGFGVFFIVVGLINFFAGVAGSADTKYAEAAGWKIIVSICFMALGGWMVATAKKDLKTPSNEKKLANLDVAGSSDSRYTLQNKPNSQLEYQDAKNIKLLIDGGYVVKGQSNYYNLLLFENMNTCKKATIHKSQEINPGGVIFLTLIKSCMNIPGNKGSWSYNTEKNELLVKFNLDKNHEQTFRCKLRKDGTIAANVFYKNENGVMEKDVREYYFDPNFSEKFIL